MNRDFFVSGSGLLRPGDAVAALIVVESDGYLMQLRDSRPDIWYPGHWGLFGGGVEPGEDPAQALARELREELELELSEAHFFASFNFDLTGLGLKHYLRDYYVVPITRTVCHNLVLHEGVEMRVFDAEQILWDLRVAPYDTFALFLHHSRRRLVDSD